MKVVKNSNSLRRDVKLELIYVAVAVTAIILLLVTGHLVMALCSFMVAIFTFAVWRIGRAKFR
jgi:hypothetical protein